VKYLITGCFGFVGGYLVRELLSRDPDAVIVGVDARPAPPEFPVATSYALDLLDLAAFGEVLARERPDHLVHLASFSSVGFSWKHPVESFTNNTNIFLDVLECVRLHSPRTRILSVGSSEEYGIVGADEVPLRETSPLRPISPYAVARVAQEHLGDVYVRGFGLDIVATRSFNHVGAGQTDQFVISAIGKQMAEHARGERDHLAVGTTSVIRDFLDVRDVATAYAELLAHGRTGEVYNVCSGRGVSIDDVIGMFAAIAGQKPEIRVDPALVRPIENAIVVGSHDKLTAAVGWRPVHSLEASLETVYQHWYRRHE
jgi:GDP-4-dehydro-6-deoxy-D-mannose reductase